MAQEKSVNERNDATGFQFYRRYTETPKQQNVDFHAYNDDHNPFATSCRRILEILPSKMDIHRGAEIAILPGLSIST